MSDLPQMSPEEIAELRAQHAQLIAERDAERQRADEEARRAETLQGQVIDSGRRLNESAVQGLESQEREADATVSSVATEIAGLKKEIETLLSEGKFAEVADVQEKMGDATARRNAAVQAKAYFAQQRTQAQAQPVDPIERFFQSNPQFTEAERDWIKRNPRYATDTAFQARVNEAHAKAMQKGVARQSEDYFKELENAGYMRRAPQTAAAPPPAAATQQEAAVDPDNPYSDAAAEAVEEPVEPQRPAPRPAAAAAPPSRRSPTAPPARQVVAQLTPEQADTALRSADLAPLEIQQQGDAAILNWWAELNQSATAKRLRAEWAGA